MLIEQWRREYNTHRPHSSLGYRPPASEAMARPKAAQPTSASWTTPQPKGGADPIISPTTPERTPSIAPVIGHQSQSPALRAQPTTLPPKSPHLAPRHAPTKRGLGPRLTSSPVSELIGTWTVVDADRIVEPSNTTSRISLRGILRTSSWVTTPSRITTSVCPCSRSEPLSTSSVFP